MHWYVVHTKPRQEFRALQNLEQQGYECFLPLLPRLKARGTDSTIVEEPLFPRYLFVRLGTAAGKGLTPIRSTKGVSRLVCFGTNPALAADDLISALRHRQSTAKPIPAYSKGDHLLISSGAFAGLEAVYLMDDGERRAMVLIELLNRPLTVKLPQASLKKIG